MSNLKIGIVIADIDEFLPLANIIRKGDFSESSYMTRTVLHFNYANASVVAVHCGIGKVNAAAAAAHLIDEGCNIILNYGLSGGISGVLRGDIVVCDRYLEHDFDLSGIGYKPCEKPGQPYIYNCDEKLLSLCLKLLPGVKQGTAVSGDSFICDKKVSDFLKETFNATSCDMETAAIASVCTLQSVPFIAVRKISDDASDTAADSYREMNSSNQTALPEFILKLIEEISV